MDGQDHRGMSEQIQLHNMVFSDLGYINQVIGVWDIVDPVSSSPELRLVATRHETETLNKDIAHKT